MGSSANTFWFFWMIVGLAIALNSVRSLVVGEGMYDRENTSSMIVSGWFAMILGLMLAMFAWKMMI